MVDFIVSLFVEIADFFITFWVDKVIDFSKAEEEQAEWVERIISKYSGKSSPAFLNGYELSYSQTELSDIILAFDDIRNIN